MGAAALPLPNAQALSNVPSLVSRAVSTGAVGFFGVESRLQRAFLVQKGSC